MKTRIAIVLVVAGLGLWAADRVRDMNDEHEGRLNRMERYEAERREREAEGRRANAEFFRAERAKKDRFEQENLSELKRAYAELDQARQALVAALYDEDRSRSLEAATRVGAAEHWIGRVNGRMAAVADGYEKELRQRSAEEHYKKCAYWDEFYKSVFRVNYSDVFPTWGELRTRYTNGNLD